MIYGLALCAGGYGLEAGLHIVLPGTYRTVCAVERQAFPVACLASAMENKALAPFPVWDDVATFDPEPWRGLVHIITAGYPCQPFSLAGKRLGENDPRHLWPYIFRHICALKPCWVFCENVAAHLTNGFPIVRAELSEAGYRVEAGIFAAAHVGAPHERERLFFLAQLSDACGGPSPAGTERSGRTEGANPDRSGARTELADNQGDGRNERRPESARKQGRSCLAGGSARLGDADWCGGDRGTDQQRRPAQGGIATCRASCMGNADNEPAWAGLCQSQQEGFRFGRSCDSNSERWPWPAGRGENQYPWEAPRLIKSGMGGTTHGVGVRNEQLYMLGNGVVPVAAAMAFMALWQRLNGD